MYPSKRQDFAILASFNTIQACQRLKDTPHLWLICLIFAMSDITMTSNLLDTPQLRHVSHLSTHFTLLPPPKLPMSVRLPSAIREGRVILLFEIKYLET